MFTGFRFVADKDDEGSPTDDSGGDDSDASKSGDEKEARGFLSCLCYLCSTSLLLYLWCVWYLNDGKFSEACQEGNKEGPAS